MTLTELISALQKVLAEHPDLADRDVLDHEGDFTYVKVHEVTPDDEARGYVKGLTVG